MSFETTIRINRGVLVGDLHASWAVATQDVAFVPEMDDAERAELRTLELPTGTSIIGRYEGTAKSPTTPDKMPVTAVTVRALGPDVVDDHPDRIQEAESANTAKVLEAAGALAVWWLGKSGQKV